MKKNIIILFTIFMGSFALYGYVTGQVTFIKKQSESGKVHASKADLRGANLQGLQAQGGEFVGIVAQPRRIKEDLNKTKNPTADDTKRGYSILYKETNFSNADLSGANLTNANVEYANFRGAVLDNATLFNANCRRVDFRGASFKGLKVIDLEMVLRILKEDKPNITEKDLEGVDLSGYQSTTFCGAIMPDGKICSGDSWTDSDGNIFLCRCESDDSATST